MEYFRVPPRWLFVKVTDEDGNVGWGEASLEGHTQAVEGCLDAWFEKFKGHDAEYVSSNLVYWTKRERRTLTKSVTVRLSTSGRWHGALGFIAAGQFS